jgi:copper chaperone
VTQTTLSVPEIHCDHCKMSIESAVGALDGVTSAVVDVPARAVTVSFDAPATLETIVTAIEDQGYDVPDQA